MIKDNIFSKYKIEMTFGFLMLLGIGTLFSISMNLLTINTGFLFITFMGVGTLGMMLLVLNEFDNLFVILPRMEESGKLHVNKTGSSGINYSEVPLEFAHLESLFKKNDESVELDKILT